MDPFVALHRPARKKIHPHNRLTSQAQTRHLRRGLGAIAAGAGLINCRRDLEQLKGR